MKMAMGSTTVVAPRRERMWRSEQKARSLAELERGFAEFREKNRRGARVPMELRAAVLEAVDRGVGPGKVQHACGVSWSQLAAWRSERDRSVSGQALRPADRKRVRAFAVVDEAPVRPPHATSTTGDDRELELRLGNWSVRVRLAELGPKQRG
jgi:hypothetical protein